MCGLCDTYHHGSMVRMIIAVPEHQRWVKDNEQQSVVQRMISNDTTFQQRVMKPKADSAVLRNMHKPTRNNEHPTTWQESESVWGWALHVVPGTQTDMNLLRSQSDMGVGLDSSRSALLMFTAPD